MTTAVIGALRVNLGLDSAAFSKGLGESGRQMQGFGRQMQSIGKQMEGISGRVKAALGGLAAGVSVAGLQRLVNDSLGAADAIAKAADRAGVGTAAFQELSHAADAAGVSTQDLETMLAKLGSRIGTAVGGGSNPFKQLGIDVRDASGAGRTATAVLDDLADRYATAGTAAQQAAILTAAFGEEGRKLAPLLKNGSEGLKQLREEARRYGLVIDEETLRRAESFNDQMSLLGKVITTNFQGGVLQGFLGNMKDLRSVFSDPQFINGLRQGGILIGTLGAFLVTNSREIVSAAVGLSTAFLALQTSAAAFGKAGKAGLGVSALAGLAAGLTTYYSMTGTAQEKSDQFTQTLTQLRTALEGVGETAVLAGKAIADPWATIGKATQDARFELDLLKSDLSDVGKEVTRTLYSAGLINSTTSPIDAKHRGAVEEYALALDDLRAEQQRVADAMAKSLAPVTNEWAGLEQVGIQTIGRIGDSLAGIFRSGGKAAVDWKELVLSTLADVAEEMLKLAITAPLQQLFAPTPGGATAGPGAQPGAAGGSPWAAAFSQLAGSALQAFTASLFHDGGTVGTGGRPRIVPAALFAGAPRFHSGGMPGLKPNEVPAILEQGEVVLTAEQAAGAGRSRPAVNLTVNNYSGAEVQQSERANAAGGVDLELTIGAAAARQMTRPGTAANRAMASTFGLKSQVVRR